MHLPTRFHFTAALALSLCGACSSISVNSANTAHAARPTDCAIHWETGSYQRLAADYEWVGEVTVHNQRGLSLSDDARASAEEEACELGGDTLLRTTAGASTNLESFDNHKLGVLRRRSPSDTADEAKPAEDAPEHEDSERVAGASRRSGALLR